MANELDMRDVGRRIADARRSRGLSQLDLAETLGVTDKTVRNMESGQRIEGWARVHAVARALGITPNDLLGFAAPPDRLTAPKLAAALEPVLPGYGRDALTALLDTALRVIEATDTDEAGTPSLEDYSRVSRALSRLP